jgi:hypothetical protein
MTLDQKIDSLSIEELDNAVRSESNVEMKWYVTLIGAPIAWGFIDLASYFYKSISFFTLENVLVLSGQAFVVVGSFLVLRHEKRVFVLMRSKLEEKRLRLQNTRHS